MNKKKLIVIGGGAAGFFCAIQAAIRNSQLEVVLVEKTGKLLSKVRVSGGGRCNVTHACFDIQEMSRHYPRGGNFVKKSFHQFFTTDTIKWFEERGVPLKTEPDGRMFPVTNSSETIIDCLLKEAEKNDVSIRLHAEVKNISNQEGRFHLKFASGQIMDADYLCIACGGFPKESQFEWLKETGHSISSPVPSLFTFNLPEHPITKLMGVSVESVQVKIIGTKLLQQGPLLITHWGLSGPAILKLSAWGAGELYKLNYDFRILINWIPQYNEQTIQSWWQQLRIERSTQKIRNKNPFVLPTRLWEFILDISGITLDKKWGELTAKEQNLLIKNLCAYECPVKGKTTFKEEFVTAGGIHLTEVDPNSMMSRKLKNLFFAGEILDVDGVTGGFNFQHAWTSGYVAGNRIAELSMQ